MSYTAPERLNIAEYFLDRRIEEGRGDRIALRTDSASYSYRQVQALANRFGNKLRELGVERQDRVLIALPDGSDFVGALFGTLKLGAVVVMVNPALEPDSLTYLFDSSRARVAVIDPGILDTYRAASLDSTDSRWQPELLVIDGELDASPELETAATDSDEAAIWLFSGGTTGRPKAVVQTHRSFANTTEHYAKAALGYSENDITLSIPKLYFGYATGSNLMFPFSVGASAVLFPERPSPEVVFDQIERHRPSILINVPTMVNQMVSHQRAAEQDLSCLRFATSAGEALPVPLYERWKETFGVELLDGLGTAEMWHIFVSNTPGAVKPGTLGRVVPGFEIEVRDSEGAAVPDGEIGQMWVRGDSRAQGYWQNPEKTSRAFHGEWFVGGDLISRDSDGYVTYCGRGDDVLKVGGKWLAPQEVESCLMKHPAVKECAVVGVENEEGLTKPVAFVVTKNPAEVSETLEDDLKQFVLETLQPYKHPRRVVFLDGFARTHLGKIDRGKLKALAAE